MAPDLRTYLHGDVDKDTLLKKFFPVVMGVFFALILVAYLLWPPDGAEGPYVFGTQSISSLGDWSVNTNGWIFFSIALVWIGLLIWPIIPYCYRRLKGICLKTSRFGAFFGLLAPVGLVLTAIFAENGEVIPGWGDVEYGDIHGPVAVLGFGGLGIMFLIWMCPVLNDRFQGNKTIAFKKLLPGMTVFLVVLVGLIITQTYASVADIPHCNGFSSCHDVPLLEWGLWEWLLLIALVIYIPVFIWALPAEPGDEANS